MNIPKTTTAKSSGDWIGYYRKRSNFSRFREAAGKLVLNSFQKVIRKEIAGIIRGMNGRKDPVSLISLGSGLDFIAYRLKKEFRERIEIEIFDISPECLARNRELFGDRFTYTAGDIFRHDFGERRYDIVYNTGLLEHFSVPEQETIIRRIASLLAAPGCFATINPYRGGKFYIGLLERLKRRGRWRYGEETPLETLAPFAAGNFTLVREYPCCSLMQLSFLRHLHLPGFILFSPLILLNRLFYSRALDNIFGRFLGYYVIMSLFRKEPDEIQDRQRGDR